MRLLLAFAVASLATAATAQDAAPATGGVCARLAPQLGLKLEPAKGKEPATWRAGMFGLGATLFGGSAGASFGVQPIDGTTQAQITDACKQVKAGITCTLSGPVKVVVGTKKGEASTDLAPGERAEVGMTGKHVFCRDGTAA